MNSPPLFNNDPLCPIFDSRAGTHLATKDVAFIGSGVPEYLSSKIVPSQPKDNLCFMVDVKYLEDWKDVLSDDLGVLLGLVILNFSFNISVYFYVR